MREQVKSLLIVSPHFPPSNTPDSQRVRILLPFFRENGWQVTVLAVEAEQVASPLDSWLEEGLPDFIKVVRVKAMGLAWRRIPGLGSLDFRAVRALKRAGDNLLARKQFDLIYFSTTVFGLHVLGPHWKKKFDVPFIMDYQDPWVTDYYKKHSDISPPGGKLKYAVSQWLSHRNEPRVLGDCAGITSVSPDYPEQIRQSYELLSGLKSLVLPFPASKQDFERIENSPDYGTQLFDSTESLNFLYVGVSGPFMQLAVSSLFKAVSDWREHNPQAAKYLHMYFIGTSYAPTGYGKKSIIPIAEHYGVDDIVTERTDRVPYSEMLCLLKSADALIVPGSDDPAYTASKVYPYLLACKPLLAVFHEGSSVVDLLKNVGGGKVVSFNNDEGVISIAKRIRKEWLESEEYCRVSPLNQKRFAFYTDQASAGRLCEFFFDVLST